MEHSEGGGQAIATAVLKEHGHNEFEVDVQGNRIGYNEPYLQIPDQFYDRQLQGQLVLGAAFLGLSALLGIAAVGYGLRYHKRDKFDTRFALAVGGLVAVLSFVDTINSLPGVLELLPAETATTPWVVAIVVGAAVSALFFGGVTAVFTGAGKRLANEDFYTVIQYDDIHEVVGYGLDLVFPSCETQP